MRLIILAAGDAFVLDGFNKLAIKHPRTGQSILDIYRQCFEVERITCVVGYRAMDIMNEHPDLDYVWNERWRTTRNGYSLGLALDDQPCYVVSSDYFVCPELVALLDAHPDTALVERSENRIETSLNCRVGESDELLDVYSGSSTNNDPELLGLFKISDLTLLKEWKRRCLRHGDRFIGQNLPVDPERPVQCVFRTGEAFFEINSPKDYIRFMRACEPG